MLLRKPCSRIFLLLPLSTVICLAGCGKFFVPVNPTPPPSGSGNYFYVANSSATASLAGFALNTKGMTNTASSPYALGVAPSALAVTPNGKYIYAGTVGAIYGFSVGSNGDLSLLNGGSALITNISPSVLRVDPSGNWLIEADAAPQAFVFSINPSTGVLSQQGAQLDLSAGAPNHIMFTPSNGLVYIALGTGGVQICTFSPSSGVLTKTGVLVPRAQSGSDNGLAVDPGGKYLFVAETAGKGLRVLSISASGALTEVSGSPFQTGLGPSAVLVDSTGGYVYVANRTDGTISAFVLTASGSLTAVSGSPFATGLQPSDLAEDPSHTYLGVACVGGGPDFQVFTIGSATSATPGGLTSFAKTTGSNPSGTSAVVAAD